MSNLDRFVELHFGSFLREHGFARTRKSSLFSGFPEAIWESQAYRIRFIGEPTGVVALLAQRGSLERWYSADYVVLYVEQSHTPKQFGPDELVAKLDAYYDRVTQVLRSGEDTELSALEEWESRLSDSLMQQILSESQGQGVRSQPRPWWRRLLKPGGDAT